MTKYLKYASCLIATIAVGGCITTNKHDVRQADGTDTGNVVIFTGDQIETVGVFVNDKFIAALPQQHKVSHRLCNGEYQLKIRSVSSPLNKHQSVLQVATEKSVNVIKGQTQYYQIQRTTKGWELTQATILPEQLKENDDKLVRRIPDTMLKCE